MSTETAPGIGDLIRNWMIAVNEKRDVDEDRKYDRATATDVTRARDRVAECRRAVDEAMEPVNAPAHIQGALILSEEIR